MTVSILRRRQRMGAILSKKRQRMRKWSWSGPAGHHSPYPIDYVPYPGSDLLYCFIDIMATYRIVSNMVNLGPQGVTTNVEEHLKDLEYCYSEGFVLNQFVRIPGMKSTTVVQDWGEIVPYQAILSMPVRSYERGSEKWELHIDKQILSTKMLATADYQEEHDLLNTIEEWASKGARLVCAVPIGYVRSQSTNDQYKVMGVDLFFNIPKHEKPTKYKYHTIKLPIRYYVVPDVTQTFQQIDCEADWMGQMKVFLDVGWKLVDICIDTTALADAFGMKSSSRTIDTIWIFEKEENSMEDHHAVYEGVIIEYLHKTKSGGEIPCKDWRPVIAGMGLNGWELTTIIQTPILVQSSFTKYTMKLLMIFQRRIFDEHQRQSKREMERQKANKQCLTYNRYGVSCSLPRDFYGPPSLGGQQPKGYYNQVLKRYVYDEHPEDQASTSAAKAPSMPSSPTFMPMANGMVTTGIGARENNPPPTYRDVMHHVDIT